MCASAQASTLNSMNPRVDRWREKFYPGVNDWDDYDNGTIGRDPESDAVPA